MEETAGKVNIFWTGGLDSTFRLVQLLATTTKTVQPHYIVRAEESTGQEVSTMIRIRRSLFNKFPDMERRFMPTVFTNEELIPKYDDIEHHVEELKKIGKVHEQYEVMSRYCRKFNVESIEVALTRITGEKEMFQNFKGSEAFRNFTYPTIELSKQDMFNIARENGWDEILYMTSFCRRPKVKIKPCGLCGPCGDAVASGMGFRFPFSSKMKARIQIPFRNYYRKNYLKHDKFLFRIIKKLFENRF